VRSENFRAYLSGIPEPLDNAAWSSFMIAFTTGFPDSRISIEACIAEGDTVVTRWTLTGTHQGMFQGIPPTERPVRFKKAAWLSIGPCSTTLLSYNKLARCRRSAREPGVAGIGRRLQSPPTAT
jgi:hypothetical protein